MLRLLLVFCLSFLPLSSWSTNLDDIRAHEPSSRVTWAEQWFYNVAAPGIGYFKISFQTYIAPDSVDGQEKAYMHLAFTPLQGATVKYDLFYDEVILEHPTKADAFYYEVPGIIVADEEQISVTHEDFAFSLAWDGPHTRYWGGLNPGQTPFGIIPELPGVGGKWFLYTVTTPVQYSFDDGVQRWSGPGYAQVDKGWYDKESSAGMMYTMGLSDEVAFMFTGAVFGDSSVEMWAGRYVSDNYDLVFYPAFKGLSVKREIDACAGELHVELNKIGKKLVLDARAAPESFYLLNFPSVIIFGGEQNYMKSMKAEVDFNLYHLGELKETIHLPQALLEFSGPFACSQLPD
ncbi:hypothetical protein [Thalassomonas actiniarum]|uniref:AttH domain-containing protein n=1 Tax=Thalassomonas actiniarum TaxID=485447 RepID=A0AAE9YVD3_9GAMM|nr:hypothetical protein [Thalassomonas actiniarum]WDE01533.1 hypothetical protein SG35_013480 [Thalassomonas actiniarum]